MSFYVGARYLSRDGHAVRTIDRINGDDIYWHDKFGSGQCSQRRFNQWASELSPDSPPAPQVQKAPKRITNDIGVAVQKEFDAVQNFRKALAGIKVNTGNSDRQALIGVVKVRVDMNLDWLEKEMKGGNHSPWRWLTRIDDEAAALQSAISALVDALAQVPEATSKASVLLLLRVLADGSEPLVRLRSVIAPCLGH